jgi:hypothetical protein
MMTDAEHTLWFGLGLGYAIGSSDPACIAAWLDATACRCPECRAEVLDAAAYLCAGIATAGRPARFEINAVVPAGNPPPHALWAAALLRATANTDQPTAKVVSRQILDAPPETQWAVIAAMAAAAKQLAPTPPPRAAARDAKDRR